MDGPPLPPEAMLPVEPGDVRPGAGIPISSDRARFAIEPQFARFGLRVVTVLRFLRRAIPSARFSSAAIPDASGSIPLAPGRAGDSSLGFEHILDGIDHLLFLFCLVIPLRGIKQLVIVVTAFTVAHSITLFSAAFGYAPARSGFRRSSRR